jgi:Tol biopolymer transport system component
MQLKKVAISGGASKVLCDAALFLGATWYPDNTIIYAEIFKGSISRVSADGGTPEPLVLNEGPNVHVPQLLPDGKTLLFTSGETGAYKIVLKSLETEERQELFAGQAARYLPSGQIVYALDDNLYARPFDLGTLEVGDPVHKVEGVLRWEISDSGTMVYIPGRNTSDTTSPVPQLTLFWVDRQGKVEKISELPAVYSQFKISPDGTKVAVTKFTEEGSSDIYIWDFKRETPSRLTFNGNSTDPLWTPDSQRIVFVAGNEDNRGIYCKNANGTGKEELLSSMSEG